MSRLSDDYTPGTASAGSSLPGVSAQAWTSISPTDQSTLVQGVIDATWAAGGGTVTLPVGVWYGSFKMRPNVDLVGLGWQTAVRALPGQTAPVLNYATYNAYHTVVRNLRVDGNYIYNRQDGVTQGAGRCIDMSTTPTTEGSYPFNNSGWGSITPMSDGSPQQAGTVQAGDWNDSANTLDRVLITAAGGDWAVYLSPNQRGAWLHDVFVLYCKNGAIQNAATDTQCTNVTAGGCGDGILIVNANQQWTNCKSWYHGVSTGYTGNGDGWRVTLPRDNTIGPTRLVGCEAQDNQRYGLNLDVADSVVASAFVSGGDSGAGVNLKDAKNCRIQVHFATADRAQDTVGIRLDGAVAGAPSANVLDWTCDLGQFATAFTPYALVNAAPTYGNRFDGPARQRGVDNPALTTSLTPRALVTLMSGNWTGNLTINNPVFDVPGSVNPGEEIVVTLFDGTGGHTVTWGAAYGGAAGFTTTASKRSTFKFLYLGFGAYTLVSSNVNN